MTGKLVMLVDINTLKLNRLPVKIKHIALYLKPAETHIETGVFLPYLNNKSIEFGAFGAPMADIGNFEFIHICKAFGKHRAVFVEKFVIWCERRRYLQAEKAVGKILIQGGNNL